MKLLLYQDGKVIDTYSAVTNPKKTESGVKWDTGELSGVSVPFILVSDDTLVKRGDELSIEWINIESIPFEEEDIVNLKQENTLLKAQMQAISDRSDFHEELIAEMAILVYP